MNNLHVRENTLPQGPDGAAHAFDAARRGAAGLLLSNLYQGNGLFLLTGQPASGRTTLLRHVSRQLGALDGVVPLSPSGPLNCRAGMTLADILEACAPRLPLRPGSRDTLQVARRLQQIAEDGSIPVLLADDAHLLDDTVLETLLTLTTLQANQRRLLSAVLAGTPALADRVVGLLGEDAPADERVVVLASLIETTIVRLPGRRPEAAPETAQPAAQEPAAPAAPEPAAPAAPEPAAPAAPATPYRFAAEAHTAAVGPNAAPPDTEARPDRREPLLRRPATLPDSSLGAAPPSDRQFHTPPPFVRSTGSTRLSPQPRRRGASRSKLFFAGGAVIAVLLAAGSVLWTDGSRVVREPVRTSATPAGIGGLGTPPAADDATLRTGPLPEALPAPAAGTEIFASPAGSDAWWRAPQTLPPLPTAEPDPVAELPPAGFGGAADAGTGGAADRSVTAIPSDVNAPEAPPPALLVTAPPQRPPAAAAAAAPKRTGDRELASLPPPPAPAPAAAPARPKAAAPQPSATQLPSRQRQVAILLSEGDRLLDEGDLEGARASYEGAFERGSGVAARRLAETYDPRSTTARPAGASPEEAVLWYQDAARRGDRRARAELVALQDWLETSAAAGNAEARRVLDAWRRPAEPEEAEPTP